MTPVVNDLAPILEAIQMLRFGQVGKGHMAVAEVGRDLVSAISKWTPVVVSWADSWAGALDRVHGAHLAAKPRSGAAYELFPERLDAR